MANAFFSNHVTIPSVRDLRHFQFALQSEAPIILLSDVHIGNLKSLTQKCHEARKKVIVHVDLIGGLNKDQIGIKLLKDLFQVDGLISPNAKIVNRAKDVGLIGIHRFFLLDSRSLENGLRGLEMSELDAIEILPGPFAKPFLNQFRAVKNVPILAGGFIDSVEVIHELFDAGINGVTTSKRDLWNTMYNKIQ
ncbi:glycerol uptake operon antiterminator regulatory protein [Brevibacillus agri]|uniref:Glycerol uptake operon antiterminator regulatory protein n=1 Tax=Brevibacillus agri TaxID=51101 RepID=A0A3M8ARK3_9BACL|nr:MULTISPECIES: glycerol-3-phosphate responsive antiterminator [Brevibacillus]MBG9568879.1 glycerol-3-phosphate responsive antiterminator GlpP [Brevibacillus agri]MBY0051474.1 glycerol-3-phosphate responsive antiterminator [Brevibacillus agri]MED1823607.1 glycerol-3-phosphate responsive antiterminator [Brevibacillus agri]QAV14458.1 glycerol-3-phosphate responsive antiterminator [Brevibacillus agri]QHZ57105.1 glycerol-3-phosphate responsive antiterminator [Brevibacillus sp. NSP2.1]